jgi:hypothetical protein
MILRLEVLVGFWALVQIGVSGRASSRFLTVLKDRLHDNRHRFRLSSRERLVSAIEIGDESLCGTTTCDVSVDAIDGLALLNAIRRNEPQVFNPLDQS